MNSHPSYIKLINLQKRNMHSTLIIIVSYFVSTNASLVDTVSSVDFYPLSPEIVTETTQNLKEEECKEECQNGGNCVLTEHGSAKCSCLSGFFGEYCQLEEESCGSGFCHHASTCLEVSVEEGSFVEHMCDCTSAYTEDTHYAGEFCQYASTQFCSPPDDPNGRQFCVNGGQCQEESHLPCICNEGFSGPRCAFKIGVDGGDYAQCELPCQNGGNCQKGAKQTEQKEFMRNFVNEDFVDALSTRADLRNFEHCVCPPGFFGVHCEYQMEQCGHGEHLCFHGSTCARDGDEFGCDCFSSKMKTAGLFCEYLASSECEQWVDEKNGHRGFCTNGGHCEVDEYGSAVCICPSGYMGQHCEYRLDIHDDPFKSSHHVKDEGVGATRLSGFILIASIVLAVSAVIFINFPFGQTIEQTVIITDSERSSSHDDIHFNNNIKSNNENEEKGEYPGFSSVELL